MCQAVRCGGTSVQNFAQLDPRDGTTTITIHSCECIHDTYSDRLSDKIFLSHSRPDQLSFYSLTYKYIGHANKLWEINSSNPSSFSSSGGRGA